MMVHLLSAMMSVFTREQPSHLQSAPLFTTNFLSFLKIPPLSSLKFQRNRTIPVQLFLMFTCCIVEQSHISTCSVFPNEWFWSCLNISVRWNFIYLETWQKAGVRAEAFSKEFSLPIQFEKKHVGQALIRVTLFP